MACLAQKDNGLLYDPSLLARKKMMFLDNQKDGKSIPPSPGGFRNQRGSHLVMLIQEGPNEANFEGTNQGPSAQ